MRGAGGALASTCGGAQAPPIVPTTTPPGAAYLPVLADALTSSLAIFALRRGQYAGWVRMDPAMGLTGAVISGRWSFGLLGDTSRVLLDGDVEPATAAAPARLLQGVAATALRVPVRDDRGHCLPR